MQSARSDGLVDRLEQRQPDAVRILGFEQPDGLAGQLFDQLVTFGFGEVVGGGDIRRYRRPTVGSVICIWKTCAVLRLLVLGLVVTLAAACGSAESADVGRPAIDDGGALYLRTCGGCHGAKGTPQQQASLPGIADYSADELRLRILHGGEQMPTFAAALTDDELDQIIGYLLDS